MIPATTSVQQIQPPQVLWLDKQAAASALASAIYMHVTIQKNAARIKDYLFTTLALSVRILDLKDLPLTSEMMQEIAQHFSHLITLHAVGCTLDKKPTTARELASFFSRRYVHVLNEERSRHFALLDYDELIKQAINDNFGAVFDQKKQLLKQQFPQLLQLLEGLKLHLIQGRGDDQKSPPQILPPSSSSAAAVNHVATSGLDKEARKRAKKERLQKEKIVTLSASSAAAAAPQKDPDTAARIKAERVARKLLEKNEKEKAAKAAAKARLEEQQKEEQAQIAAQKKREQELAAKAKKLAAAQARELVEAEAERQKEAAELAALLAEKEAKKRATADAKAKKDYEAQLKTEIAVKKKEVDLALSFQGLKLSRTPLVFASLKPNPVILELRAFPVNDAQFFQALQQTLEIESQVKLIRLPICSLDRRVIKILAAHKPLQELDISLCHSIDTTALPLLSQVTKVVCTLGGENTDSWRPFEQVMKDSRHIRDHLLPDLKLMKWRLLDQETTQAFSQMTSLTYLDLDSRVCVDDTACASLAKLTQLNTLYCGKMTASAAGIKKLAPLTHLQKLRLNHCPQLNEEALDAITSQFTDLHSLILGEGNLTDRALDRLNPLKNLKNLWLGSFPQVTFEGYKKLIQLKDSLECLVLYYPTIDEALLLYLMTSLDKLKFLRLTINTTQDLSESARNLPKSVHNLAAAKGIYLDVITGMPVSTPTPARPPAPGSTKTVPLDVNQKSQAKKYT